MGQKEKQQQEIPLLETPLLLSSSFLPFLTYLSLWNVNSKNSFLSSLSLYRGPQEFIRSFSSCHIAHVFMCLYELIHASVFIWTPIFTPAPFGRFFLPVAGDLWNLRMKSSIKHMYTQTCLVSSTCWYFEYFIFKVRSWSCHPQTSKNLQGATVGSKP